MDPSSRPSLIERLTALLLREPEDREQLLELSERHRILHSWYSGLPPMRLEKPTLPSSLAAIGNRIELYRFPSPQGPEVCMTIIHPTGVTGPEGSIIGFGASYSLDIAGARASNEALQRWAFLYDETPDKNWYNLSASALFQQEFGLSTEGQGLLLKWLSGDLERLALRNQPYLTETEAAFHLSSIEMLGEELQICQCTHPSSLPLIFWPQPKALLPWIPNHEPLWIHPIA